VRESKNLPGISNIDNEMRKGDSNALYFILDLNEFWGKGNAKSYKEDKTIKPFKISYSPEVSPGRGRYR
jgi:hypothetical protein